MRDTLGPVADSGCNISVKKGDKDFSAAVTQVKGVARTPCSTAATTRRPRRSCSSSRTVASTGTFVSADGTKDPQFVNQAGEAAKDAILSCPCGPATGTFADEYKKKFNARSRAPTAPRATTWAPSC